MQCNRQQKDRQGAYRSWKVIGSYNSDFPFRPIGSRSWKVVENKPLVDFLTHCTRFLPFICIILTGTILQNLLGILLIYNIII